MSYNSFKEIVTDKEEVFKGNKKEVEPDAIPDLQTIFNSKLSVEYLEGRSFYVVKRNPLGDVQFAALKKGFDILFASLVILFILSWLTPLIALLIKLDSNGPVFYRQRRSGRNNIVFDCFKFRTMSYEKDAEFKAATKNDSRVTKFGRFLRKTSIDEFPQFFNVLIGNMSVVGPRPHVIKLDEDYKFRIEKYELRNAVKPGITGLAQAKGYRGEVFDSLTMKQRVKVDIFYIENWSLWLDIRIISLTIYNMCRGDKNAY